MKVLCLHGRGSNNDIFKMQTAAFQHYLKDFVFEFVQGTVLHTEGNWSLFTTAFSKLPLYTYYDPFVPQSILQTEAELLRIIEEDGPFDGVIGYSGGGAAAAQLLIRDCVDHPWKLPHERVFRWAVFINSGSPLEVFPLADADIKATIQSSAEVKEAVSAYIRHSNTRARKGDEKDPNFDPERIRKVVSSLSIQMLADGRLSLADKTHGITRYDGAVQGPLIDVPTLHVRCPKEEDRHHGLHLLECCEPSLVKEFHHQYGHDFPRGHAEMRKIAELIRETAERS